MDQPNFLKRPAGGGEKNIESIGKKGGKARELKLNSASLLHLLFPSLPPPRGGESSFQRSNVSGFESPGQRLST